MIIGWALLMFGVGLLRKERGEYAALRRYGVQVNADVLERTTAESVLKTEASMPDVKITRFYVRATWIIDPQKLGIGNKYFRWVAIRRLVSRWCRQRRGQPTKVSADCSAKYPSRLPTILAIPPDLPVLCVAQEHVWERYRVHTSSLRRGWSASKARSRRLWSVARAGTALASSSDSDEEPFLAILGVESTAKPSAKITRTVSFAEVDGKTGGGSGGAAGGSGDSSSGDQAVRVEKRIQVSSTEWEQVVEKHMVIRICYDPMIGGSAMPLSGITGQATPRLLLWMVSAFVGLSIIMMGMVSCRETTRTRTVHATHTFLLVCEPTRFDAVCLLMHWIGDGDRRISLRQAHLGSP
eukprot:COSAG02_NODE_4925_length_4831_cov_2.178149_5_plen_353_part_00